MCLLTLNYTRNNVVTYTKYIHEKFTCFWLAETECICHVTLVQSWNMNTMINSAHAVKISFALPLRDAFFMYFITK